jgi:3-phenylpropionate/trans-cinnamate dioxygenase ferredoxin reductase component
MLGKHDHFVAIGGGQAAYQAIQSLRTGGHTGPVTLIGDEPALPYQRPPLSKDYLKGMIAPERLFFRPETWYAEHDIHMRLGVRAVAIDPETRRIRLSDGTDLAYEAALIATGARPRKLSIPGAGSRGIFEIRRLSDIEALRSEAVAGRRVVVIGAGYIGLEAAAVLRTLGLPVTVLEVEGRVLARVTGAHMSDFFERLHAGHGVEIRKTARVSDVLQANGRVAGVMLAEGDVIPAEIVIAGIGILPNQEIAAEADIACENGVRVDEDGRTSAASVFAAGDCTSRPLPHYDGLRMRLESVHNAVEQGRLVAAALLGQARPPQDVPWFWSDQYDVKLQIAGIGLGHDSVVMRPGLREGSFSVFSFRQDRLLAVDAVNAPADYMTGKKLIAAGAPVNRSKLADPSVPMKTFLG